MGLHVRPAEERDLADLVEISRKTWDGFDYLENTAPGWLSDKGFMVGELDGKVIACGKITSMPGRTAWLEGLRVHQDYRGKGYGRVMSERVLAEAERLTRAGEFSGIEFSTYIRNMESRKMAEDQGFRIVELFHVLGFEDPELKSGAEVKVREIALPEEELSVYADHVPCGWKYVLSNAPDVTGWLAANARFWRTGGGAAFITCNRDFEISPLASSLDDPAEFVRGALSMAVSMKHEYSEMMIHDSHGTVIRAALEAGYSYWEDPGTANIPVYRFFSDREE